MARGTPTMLSDPNAICVLGPIATLPRYKVSDDETIHKVTAAWIRLKRHAAKTPVESEKPPKKPRNGLKRIIVVSCQEDHRLAAASPQSSLEIATFGGLSR
mmetsp:Transcript_85388/g.133427  ORF Transcript_85388/g.133427 Transcript_85388/m.133427 type:complete len:101 (+) Transcript_85388:407-709(+)